jgi:hypothetical protein
MEMGNPGMPRIDHFERLMQPLACRLGQVRSDSRKVGLVLRRWLACLVEQDDLWPEKRNAIVLSPDFIKGSRHGFVPAEDPVLVCVFVEEKLARPGSTSLVGTTRPNPVDRSLEMPSVPRFEGVLGCGVPHVPAPQVAEERGLIAPQNSDIEIVVATSFSPEEEIERPASADPPRRPQPVEKASEVCGLEWLPSPKVSVIARLHGPSIVARVRHRSAREWFRRIAADRRWVVYGAPFSRSY